ncbi:MAG: class beta-lactamase-related serine hydrolase, partial [Gammaproteobacteria bacterium]|nr:class beta-lactamase-related serine hydrolase [Gammaproteobacteria bacterium]
MSTVQFDGVDYPDDAASDPNSLGWMQGSPPPPDRIIRFADDDFLAFPRNRWALSHMRELVPTVNVWRGGRETGGLGTPTAADEAAIDALTFADLSGQPRRWGASLADTYTDGMAILHRGRLVYERYRGALRPELPHACFSITKSYAATLAAMLIYDGVLDQSRTVLHYLPEMTGTAYGDATLREVLDMQIGVAYSELYSDPTAQIWQYARAGGLRPRPPDYQGPSGFHEFLVTLRKEGEHGGAFSYKTVNTEVLCWVMQRATGLPLAELMSDQLWSALGCEEDGYLSVDPEGVAMGGAGLAATLRDLARFGEAMRCDGAARNRQVIPASVVADIRRGGEPGNFAAAGYTLLSGYSYRDMWWVTHDEHDAFEARGIHGQRLYVAPRAEMVVARFASHPIA